MEFNYTKRKIDQTLTINSKLSQNECIRLNITAMKMAKNMRRIPFDSQNDKIMKFVANFVIFFSVILPVSS